MDALERYIIDHSTPEDELLRDLDRETHLRVIQPRMISGPVQGKFLEMLMRMLRPKNVLEIGTFTGYSAICMACGMEEGSHLHTIDPDDELFDISNEFFRRGGLDGIITGHVGSALDVAPKLGVVFDFVFIDGDKREYPDYYKMLMDGGLVRSGSYILADNILWYGKVTEEETPHNDLHTRGIKEFNDMVRADNRVECVILPIRDGLNLARVK